MNNTKTISVIIPAYMEAANLEAAVNGTLWALRKAKIDDYELLIIDCLRPDGTHDGTPDIATSMARENSRIKVFHNRYMNMGAKYWLGVDAAKFAYCVLVPGDNELSKEALKNMLDHLGEADILASYPSNMWIRPPVRQALSHAYTFLINFSTELNLRYYNGACIFKTDIVRAVRKRSSGLTYMTELLIHFIKAGHSYKQIPITLQKRIGGKASVLKIDNFLDVGMTILRLFWRYRIVGQ